MGAIFYIGLGIILASLCFVAGEYFIEWYENKK